MMFKLPENLKPIAIVTIGYPDESPEPPKRVGINDAVEEIK
jgi:nitroreductase